MGNYCTAKIKVFSNKTESSSFLLQEALDRAGPGDTVVLEPGSYYEDIKTVRDGLLRAPITIRGPASAVVRGAGGQRGVIVVNHDHVHLEGFSINGAGGGENELDPDLFRDNLIHVQGNRVRTVSHASGSFSIGSSRSGVQGFKAKGLRLSHAGSTCMKLSYFVTHAKVVNNDMFNCGMSVVKCAEDPDGCGRGLELGTSLFERVEGLGGEIDESAWNLVQKNNFDEIGGACLMLHEGTRANIIDGNTCIDSRDASEAGVVLRGDANTLISNSISDCGGAAIAVGGANWAGHHYGVFNQIVFNDFTSNERGTVFNGTIVYPSGIVCGNVVDDNLVPELSYECGDVVSRGKCHGAISNGTTAGGGKNTDALSDPIEAPQATNPPSASGKQSGGNEYANRERKVASPSGYVCHPVLLSSGDVVLDGDPTTYWSRFGMGQYLEFDLRSAAGDPTVEGVIIKFYQGNKMITLFEITADGEKVLQEAASSGTTAKEELFMFPDGPVQADKIRLIGFGNR
ncbi:unnamed protein product [Ascophyllum nodosum]